MALPNKKSALTIDDLMDAQRDMMKRSDVTEQQVKIAQEQLEKLEAIKNADQLANAERVKEDVDINRITKKKGDASHVSLGDLQTEVKGLRRDLTGAGSAPKDGRSPLPLMTIGGQGQAEASGAAEGETKEQRRERLERIGSAIGSAQQTLYGDVNKQTATAKNTEAYDKFIRETGKKDELLANATEDQKKIFERLEETMIALRQDDGKNSEALRQEISKLSGELGATDDNVFKEKVSGIITNAGDTARVGQRNDKGNLGDALQAAMGKKTVLKDGYEYDSRVPKVVRTTETGRFAKTADASLGRFAGAAKIAGNFFGGKIEQFNNQYKSDAIPNFLDNNFRGGPTGRERAGADMATAGALAKGPVLGSATVSKAKVSPAAMMPTFSAGSTAATAAVAPASQMSSAKVINLKAETVNLTGGAAGSGSSGSAAPAEEGGSSLGDMASSAMDMGKSGLSKAGGWLGKAAGAGKNLIGKIPGGALKGGIAALGGAALSYGGDKLKEAGYEKTGAAADVAGQAAQWGGTGAMIGSVVPGVGTAIGAGVGAVAGGAYGLYKNWGNFFGGDKKPEAAESGSVGAAGPQKSVEDLAMEQAKKYGRTEPNHFDKQAAQMMFKGQQAKAAGGEVTLQGQSAVPVPRTNNVGQLSAQNSDAKSAAPAPVVINNGSGQAPAAPPTQNMMLPRGQVRPQESAVEKYSNRQASFY